MLLILRDRVLSTERIDSIVSAEFPDAATNPVLHEAVQQFMMHSPCDIRPHLSCRTKSTDGTCTRHFPKAFCDSTRILPDGFPEYRRRGRFQGRDGDRPVGDEWVVPYNPYLLARYRCHLNVEVLQLFYDFINHSSILEVAGHIRSCKYVYKSVAAICSCLFSR